MTRNVAIRSWQAATLVAAVVLGTTGCQSSPWSMPSPTLPSFSSWSPFKSKETDSSLASSKPTSKSNVPPPVGSSASGSSSLASSRSGSSIPADPMTRSSRYSRDMQASSSGAPSGGSPSSTLDTNNRMASAAMPNKDAYHTGPYSTGKGYRPYSSAPREGGESIAASRPTSGPVSGATSDSLANSEASPPPSSYGGGAERSSYSASGYAPRVASNPYGERPSRPTNRVSANVSDEAPAPYPSTRTPNLPTALSSASNYRPGSVSRGVMPASFQNGNSRQAEAPASEEAPLTAESGAGSDSIYR